MKQLLLIFICVLFVFNSKAQDTSYLPHGLYIDTLIMTNGKIQADTNWSIYYDTIPVIMIVSDTSIKLHSKIWQQRGYSISDAFSDNYLDENKKPLSKNIVVWLAQTIAPFKSKYIW